MPYRTSASVMVVVRSSRRFVASGQVQVDSAERAEPVEERREQSGRVRGLANGLLENRAHLRLHRPAVTSRADLKAPFHCFIEVADVQCHHCYHLLPPMIALVIAMRLGYSVMARRTLW